MLETSIEAVLRQAVAVVLETMFFTEVAAETDCRLNAGPQIAASLEFEGPLRGAFGLSLPAETAATLASDFLGLDAAEPPATEQVQQVVCELANMICGRALSALEKDGLRLSGPRVVPAPGPALPAGACRRTFDLSNGRLTVALAVEDQNA